jgi:hypothetical protein
MYSKTGSYSQIRAHFSRSSSGQRQQRVYLILPPLAHRDLGEYSDPDASVLSN